MIQRISSDDGDLVERLSHLPVDRDTVEHYRAYLRRELVMTFGFPATSAMRD